ncbi:hypothetical protein RT761_00003 [Atribacter laminatus]|uniref:Uncharacterized protein n=1 Tax=Atribacter laminatus TaxID=2847778 RepID=A0A7T1AJ06_ATRLM|nr:hypothetical protein RT761_00003 [Atribacter laminatus]
MPELTHIQNYIARIQADLYWIERTIEKLHPPRILIP